MTADTAVICAHRIVSDGVFLSDLNFVDRPTIRLRKKEFIEMPFRYIAADSKGTPLLPPGMMELWKEG